METDIKSLKEEKNALLRKYGIIKCYETKDGNLDTNTEIKEFMFNHNMNPVINHNDKYWNFIEVMKTTTWSVSWKFTIDGNYFVGLQGNAYKIGPMSYIFKSDKKGKFEISNPIKKYLMVVDLEYAIDLFAYEYIFEKYKNKELEIISIEN